MKTGWVARIEDPQTQDRVNTLLACSKRTATMRCEEIRGKNPSMRVDLIGPYSEEEESSREIKLVISDDLAAVFKEHADLNPLLIKREGKNFEIEVDKIA